MVETLANPSADNAAHLLRSDDSTNCSCHSQSQGLRGNLLETKFFKEDKEMWYHFVEHHRGNQWGTKSDATNKREVILTAEVFLEPGVVKVKVQWPLLRRVVDCAAVNDRIVRNSIKGL